MSNAAGGFNDSMNSRAQKTAAESEKDATLAKNAERHIKSDSATDDHAAGDEIPPAADKQ